MAFAARCWACWVLLLVAVLPLPGGAATPPGTTITNTALANWAVGGTAQTASAQRQIVVAAYASGPDLGITKTGPSQVAPGSAVAWKLLVTNAGPQPANGAQVVDTVSAGVTGISAQCVVLTVGACGAAVVGPPGPGGTQATVTLATLPVGGQIEITVRGTAPPAAGALVNQAQVFVPGLVDPTPANNFAVVTTQVTAGAASGGALGGHLWLDANHDRMRNNGELPLAGYLVRIYDAVGTTLVAQATTDATGAYSVASLPAGVSYQIEFRDASGNVAFGLPVTAENGGVGFAATASCGQWTGIAPPALLSPTLAGTCYSMTSGGSTARIQSDGRILLALQPGDNVVEQGLPLDPSGVVYDSTTRQPLPGATVTITGPPGFIPAAHLLGGAANASQLTGANGFYRFLLIGGAPAGVYTLNVVPPANYAFPSTLIPALPTLDPSGLGVGGVYAVQAQPTPPAAGSPTPYHLAFDLTVGDPDVINNHIPLDPSGPAGTLLLRKTAGKAVVAPGDFMQYRLDLSNSGSGAVANVSLTDRLPVAFRYRAGSVRINGAAAGEPSISADGRGLTFMLGTVNPGASLDIRYVAEVTAGTPPGQATNTAQAAGAGGVQSLVARATVTVLEDLFRSRLVLVGRVIEAQDCDSRIEFGKGVEGVRVYLQDGTYVRTDKEGKWHVDGIRRGTHVVQLDVESLPPGYEPIACEQNSRFAGRRISQFVNAQGGTLWRADFYVRKADRAALESEVEHRLSAVPHGEGVRLRLELKGATSLVKDVVETVILPAGLVYRPGSLRIDGRTAPDPERGENILTFRLGQDSGAWSKVVEFDAGGTPERAVQVKAGGEFRSAAGEVYRLPDVGVELPRARPAVEAIPNPAAEASQVESVTLSSDTEFVLGSAELDPSRLQQLRALAARLKGMDRLHKVRVIGHTDRLSRSGADFNPRLSEAHAGRVAEFLVAQGLDAALIESADAGDSRPLVNCPGPRSEKVIACLSANRRVEIEILRAPLPVMPAPGAASAASAAPTAHAGPEALSPAASVRYGPTEAARAGSDAPANGAASLADPGIYAPGSEKFDANWLATAHPGFEVVYPPEGFNAGIQATKIYIKHSPAHKVRLTVNGTPVHALNFDGSDANAAGTVAFSRWGGVSLREGDNTIAAIASDDAGREVARAERTVRFAGGAAEAKLAPEASTLVADGRTAAVIAVRILDRDGKQARPGLEGTLKISPPYVAEDVRRARDARPLLDDFANQARWRVDADGIARIRITPTTTAGEVVLTFNFPNRPPQLVRAWLRPALREWILVGFAEGTIGHRKLNGNMEALHANEADDRIDRDGQAAFYAKGKIRGDYLVTMAYDSDKKRQRLGGNAGDNLTQTIDRKKYYTLYGDTASVQYDAASVRKLYLKIEKDAFYALFGDFDTGLTVTELGRYARTLNGIKSEFRGEQFSYTAFATSTAQAFIKDELRGDGTSGSYRLSRANILANSEKVTLETRDRFRNEVILRSEPQSRGVDYDIDYTLGTIFFRKAVPSKDQSFNPVFIVVDYESEDAARDERPTGGGRAAVRFMDNRAEAGLTLVHEGNRGASGDLSGVDFSYQIDEKTRLKAEYADSRRDFAGVRAAGDAYQLSVRRQDENLAATGYVRGQDPGFGLGQQRAAETGQSKVGADLSLKISDSLRLNAQAYQERVESVAATAERTLVESRLNYTDNDYTVYGGGRDVRDRNAAKESLAATQLVAGGSRRFLGGDLNLRLDGEATVGGNNANPDFPHRVRLGADYRISDKFGVFVDQEFTFGARENAATTRVGTRSRPWEGAEYGSSFNIADGQAGPTLSSTNSLTQSLRLGDKVSVHAGMDRTHTIRKPGNSPLNANSPSAQGLNSLQPTLPPQPVEDFTAVFAGLAWHDGPWGVTLRAEFRDAATSDRVNVTGTVHRDLRDGEALAGSLLYTSTNGDPAATTERLDLRLSYASRPVGSRWILLDRLDFIHEEMNSAGGVRSRRLVNNLNTNYLMDRRTQLALQYGAKYVFETFDGYGVSGYTDLIGMELRRDIGYKLDIGVRASLLHSWASNAYSDSYGLSLGASPIGNLWVGVGYNFAGFRDQDFSGAAYTAKGWYAFFRFKFDQGEQNPATRRRAMFDESAR